VERVAPAARSRHTKTAYTGCKNSPARQVALTPE
jgi:hypothetical protein